MFGFCSRRLQSLSLHSSVTQFQKACSFSIPYSSLSLGSDCDRAVDGKPHSFTVSYFINTFRFSPQLALSLSKKPNVHFRSSEQPDSVVKLLKDYRFSDTHVSEIVKKRPTLLLVDPQETLVPKLEFFVSIGITGKRLTRIISGNPTFLTLSVENNLRPCYDIIKALPIPDRMVSRVLSELYQGFTISPLPLSNIAPNVAFLIKTIQVPKSSPVNLCLRINLYVVSRETHKFKANVEKVIGMGVRASSQTFMEAVYVMSVLDELKWVQRIEFYKRLFGWTEDKFLLAFRKYPLFICLSEKIVLSKMNFFVERLGWQPACVAKYPHVLTFSLEKWIMPRYSVIRVLLLKGLITEEEFTLAGTLSSRKRRFLNKFVIRYKKQVPELLHIYQGKIRPADVGLGFEETGGATLL